MSGEGREPGPLDMAMLELEIHSAQAFHVLENMVNATAQALREGVPPGVAAMTMARAAMKDDPSPRKLAEVAGYAIVALAQKKLEARK